MAVSKTRAMTHTYTEWMAATLKIVVLHLKELVFLCQIISDQAMT